MGTTATTKTTGEKAVLTTRVSKKVLLRLRAIVAASPHETMEHAVNQALLHYLVTHPLAQKELVVPKALKEGRRKRPAAEDNDLLVIVDEEEAGEKRLCA